MEPILTTTIIAFLYYIVFIFAANKIVLKKFKIKMLEENKNEQTNIYFILAVNINIICSLFLTQEPVMNYMTYLINDDFGFLNILSAGSIILLINAVLLFISYLLGKFIASILRTNEFLFLQPILWVTINLILLKLTNLYYEAYITTQSVTIF